MIEVKYNLEISNMTDDELRAEGKQIIEVIAMLRSRRDELKAELASRR